MGKPRSEETKRKIAEKAKERWADPEFKARMSETMKISIAERGCSKETRVKLSKAIKKRLKDPEYRKQMSENSKKNWQDPEYRERTLKAREGLQTGENHPMWGRKHTKEAKQKMKEAHIDIQKGPDHPMYGKKHSEESRKRMSESHRGIPLSERNKLNIGKSSKHVWARKTFKEREIWAKNISAGEKGKTVSIESRKKISKAHKELWKNPEHARKCLVFNSPNKQEIKLMNLLDKMYPSEWKFVGNGQVTIAGKCPDFINVNGQKKIIELYGERWHQNDNPKDREATFKPFGYETLVVWVKELQSIKKVKPILEAFCEVA